ncbi:ribonuclease R [Seinonella peptonophila]|uniref:Ribonuclease R n=1 Tax=Seinonella peptonophila TaxID=112248 RepID=A0A1M4YN56_9BACL|nr:ribonuclease R [Seinonella peptonophila]SHF07245.1 ribonuclease R [Seinonella peptonophila]
MLSEQQIEEFMLTKAYKPLTFEELIVELSISEDERETFENLMEHMENEGRIVRTRAGRYGVPERLHLIRGVLQGSSKGFGFVIPDQPNKPDIFIRLDDLHGAIDQDVVLARIHTRKSDSRRPEGEIVRIIKRGREQIVGLFSQLTSHFGLVVPDDKRVNADIFIPGELCKGATDGQKVVVKLLQFVPGRHTAEGEVIEVLGHKDDPGIDIISIIRKHGLPEDFPQAVEQEAEQITETISTEDRQGRRDLRDRMMVTIDGEDAKDLDDAVSVEALPNGHVRLGVHIADVSYYVKEGSALDREAYERGCSVYLVDRVIPMLPRRLSNGICSLNPHVERLALTCDMEIDGNGQIVDHEIYPSLIQTNERMTYHDVKKIIIDHDEELIERYQPLVSHFRLMGHLAEILRKKRFERGAIDFNFPEAKVIIDEDGKPIEIRRRPRTAAEQLIEEFMLAANETVAEHFCRLDIPFLYRIHESPDIERLQSFYEFVNTFGYTIKGKADKVRPRVLQKLLEKIEGKPEETVISTVLLRSMKQAKYAAESVGHFGLAATFYTHFTSPIRRYPDLVIHRIIREVLTKGTLSLERIDELNTYLPDAAHQSSVRERVAVDAERETVALKQAEFMQDKIGQEFPGTISSVTNFGLFVELPNLIEGMIHLSYLTDDYYHFDDRSYTLIGERTARVFRIGDQVRIRVSQVNLDERKIDFELLEHISQKRDQPEQKTKRRKRKGTKGNRKALKEKKPIKNGSKAEKKPAMKKKKKKGLKKGKPKSQKRTF